MDTNSANAEELTVLLERDVKDDAVAIITLNQAARRNALTVVLKKQLLKALSEVAGDETVRAVVLAGSGKAFCVGQDLGEHAESLRSDPSRAFDTVGEHYNPIVRYLAEMPKPVVAAINGAAVGAGLGFALACDLRVAGEGASFSTAFAAIGLTADSGLSASLVHSLGASRASELMLLGDSVTAEQARDWGLVRAVVPSDQLLETALELARHLAVGPTSAYAEIKKALAFGAVSPLPAVLAAEGEAQARLGMTSDHQGAVEAFLGKSRPRFAGR